MKKVIEQQNHHRIEVVYHKSEGRFVFIQSKSGLPDAFIGLEKSHAKEFCEAICPELETEKIKFAVGFAEWKDKAGYIKVFSSVSGFKSLFRDGRNFEDEKEYTYNDLIQLYLTSTTNGKQNK